jgi:hypothetical protein
MTFYKDYKKYDWIGWITFGGFFISFLLVMFTNFLIFAIPFIIFLIADIWFSIWNRRRKKKIMEQLLIKNQEVMKHAVETLEILINRFDDND